MLLYFPKGIALESLAKMSSEVFSPTDTLFLKPKIQKKSILHSITSLMRGLKPIIPSSLSTAYSVLITVMLWQVPIGLPSGRHSSGISSMELKS